MNIPGDKGGNWRLDKFVEYQHEVPSIAHFLINAYAKKNKLPKNALVRLAWYQSMTYNEVTAILLLEHNAQILRDPADFWADNKGRLQFGSSRQYVKSNDKFYEMVEGFEEATEGGLYAWLASFCRGDDGFDNYDLLERGVRAFPYTGRFAAGKFMEIIMGYLDEGLLRLDFEESGTTNWKENSNLTSCLFNLMYADDEADEYDRTGSLREGAQERLNAMLARVHVAIKKRYPSDNLPASIVNGKLCSFRNLFKNARYGGFHHDRQLGVLNLYRETWPEKKALWAKLMELRREVYPDHLLGELHGWDGIRKERKKLWTTRGLTGVEREAS